MRKAGEKMSNKFCGHMSVDTMAGLFIYEFNIIGHYKDEVI